MEKEYVCPLCSSNDKCKVIEKDYYTRYHCGNYGVDFCLHNSITDITDGETYDRILDLIVEFLLDRPQYTSNTGTDIWYFNYYPSQETAYSEKPNYINTAKMLPGYPITIQEKSDRILLNLCKQFPNYDDVICLFWRDHRMIFDHNSNNHHTAGVLKLLCEMGVISERGKELFAISAKGWQRIYELQAHKDEKKQGFVAMVFKEETKSIRAAIHNAIESVGYSAMIIDEKEHNNQIVPEIFYEIDHSRFLVADVTYPNNGAYYEAGYALGKGKEVIFSCRENAFMSPNKEDRPHFDIAQKSMVIWEDEKDLVEKLRRRIKITMS